METFTLNSTELKKLKDAINRLYQGIGVDVEMRLRFAGPSTSIYLHNGNFPYLDFMNSAFVVAENSRKAISTFYNEAISILPSPDNDEALLLNNFLLSVTKEARSYVEDIVGFNAKWFTPFGAWYKGEIKSIHQDMELYHCAIQSAFPQANSLVKDLEGFDRRNEELLEYTKKCIEVIFTNHNFVKKSFGRATLSYTSKKRDGGGLLV